MIDLENIELGAGELLITKHSNQDKNNDALIWDDSNTLEWEFGTHSSSRLWPSEYYAGSSINAELESGKIGKDISIGRVKAAVKNATIGAKGTFKIKIFESSLENIMIAVGADPRDMVTDTTSEKYVFYNSGKNEYFTLRYTIPRLDDPNKKDMLEIYKVLPQGLEPLPFSKSDERSFEVSFNCIGVNAFGAIMSWSVGQFFRFN